LPIDGLPPIRPVPDHGAPRAFESDRAALLGLGKVLNPLNEGRPRALQIDALEAAHLSWSEPVSGLTPISLNT
jgi:hypothetical protein